MGVSKFFITQTDHSDTDLTDAGDKQDFANRVIRLFSEFACGAKRGSVLVDGDTTAATGTLTFASVIATDAFTVNGVTFTAVASGATGNQFNVGVDDTATAANAVTAVNASASALVANHVTATSAAGVVTMTADYGGTPGNAITIASGDATITASGARLTGGADGTEDTYSYGV